MKRREVLIGGLENSYLEEGNPDAPTLLLLHGAGFGSDAVTCWQEFLPALADRYRLIALDFYGHGESAKLAPLDRSPRKLHEIQVIEFCRALGISPRALVGSSHGGAVALYVAANGALEPFQVVDISGAGGFFHRHEGFDAMTNHRPDLDWAKEMASLGKAEPIAADIELRLQRSLVPGHVASIEAGRLRPRMPGERASLDELCAMIAASDIELLLVAGSEDPLLEPHWLDEFSRRLPRAKTLVVEGARHEPQRDHPGLIAQAIVQFVGE